MDDPLTSSLPDVTFGLSLTGTPRLVSRPVTVEVKHPCQTFERKF